MSLLLTADELEALTGYKTQACQIRELRKMEIAYNVNPKGRLLVHVAAAEKWLGVESTSPPPPGAEAEPDYSAFS